jgi:DNA-binding GntR family transcriptional regulator
MTITHPKVSAAVNGHPSLGSAAYQAIYSRIISLQYAPGQYLEEAALVDTLNIGRTPVREALQRLAADLLLESQPGKGFVVRPLTLQNTKAAFAALQILELGVAGLAVRQADAVADMQIYRLVQANSAFHDAYARCSDNIYLVQSLQRVRCETNRLAYLSYGNEIDPGRTLQEHYASVIAQHTGIIDAIGSRDEEALREIVVDHIQIFKNRIIHYLAEV